MQFLSPVSCNHVLISAATPISLLLYGLTKSITPWGFGVGAQLPLLIVKSSLFRKSPDSLWYSKCGQSCYVFWQSLILSILKTKITCNCINKLFQVLRFYQRSLIMMSIQHREESKRPVWLLAQHLWRHRSLLVDAVCTREQWNLPSSFLIVSTFTHSYFIDNLNLDLISELPKPVDTLHGNWRHRSSHSIQM